MPKPRGRDHDEREAVEEVRRVGVDRADRGGGIDRHRSATRASSPAPSDTAATIASRGRSPSARLSMRHERAEPPHQRGDAEAAEQQLRLDPAGVVAEVRRDLRGRRVARGRRAGSERAGDAEHDERDAGDAPPAVPIRSSSAGVGRRRMRSWHGLAGRWSWWSSCRPFCSRTPRRRDRRAPGALGCRRSPRRRASGGRVARRTSVPMPAPPCASDTVMQCSVLTEYRIGAIGLAMLSSRRVGGVRFLHHEPAAVGRARRGCVRARRSGSTWSWIASNTNTTSNGSVDLEPGRVAHDEAHVGEPGAAGLGARPRDRAVVEVVPDERRARERARQQHERVAGAARDVGDARAGRRAARRARARAGGTRRPATRRRCRGRCASITSVNSGRYSAYGTPPPSRNARATWCTCLPRCVCSSAIGARFVGAVGEARGPLGRQRVGAVRRVVVDDAAGDHRAEPLAHVALGEAGAVGELVARRRRRARRRRTGRCGGRCRSCSSTSSRCRSRAAAPRNCSTFVGVAAARLGRGHAASSDVRLAVDDPLDGGSAHP